MSQTYRDQLFAWMKSHVYRYSESPFRLASGLESHHYFNCKEITLHPERLAVLAECFVEEIIPKMGIEFQAVGGLTLGADPLAYSIALAYQKKGTDLPISCEKGNKGTWDRPTNRGFLEGN